MKKYRSLNFGRGSWMVATKIETIMKKYGVSEIETKAYKKLKIEEPFIAVSGIIRNTRGDILLVRHSPDTGIEDKWTTPGGKVLPNESPERAIHREIKEELDIGVLVTKLYRIIKMVPEKEKESKSKTRKVKSEDNAAYLVIYECSALNNLPRPNKKEIIEAKWFSKLPEDMLFKEDYLKLFTSK